MSSPWQWESCKLELRATSYPGYRQCPPYLSLSNTQIFKKKIKSIRLEAFPRDVKVPTGWMRSRRTPGKRVAPAGEVGEREPGGLSSTGHKGEPGTPSGILALPHWANPSLPASASRGPHTRAGSESRQQH